MLSCFKTLFRHQISQLRGTNFQKFALSGGSVPPEPTATGKLLRSLRGNFKKHFKKSTKSGGKNVISREGGGNDFKTKNIPLCTTIGLKKLVYKSNECILNGVHMYIIYFINFYIEQLHTYRKDFNICTAIFKGTC